VTDLLVVSLESWDGVWRRNQHLVSRLLAADPRLRVLFVEPPADPLHDLSRRSRVRPGRGLRRADLPGAEGRLWLFQPTKWLPRRLDPAADTRLSSAVVRAARRVGMTRPVLWLNDPLAADLLRRTGWPALYDITDDWLVADRSPREHDRLVESEDYLLTHCRHVVVCSPRLLETKQAERVTLVPNAVDVDAYLADAARPGDLPPGPVALYVGTLHRDRLDVHLCATLAAGLRGTATLVLVGPVALGAADQTLLIDAGAVLLGAREHTTVPAYLKNADVLVVPHVVTEFTDSLDPIKVYEYLAAARPVVSTPVAGFRGLDRDRVSVVPGSDFLARTREHLASPPRAAAASPAVPSWDDRADAMRAVVDEVARP
jgi:teichuronic acid biosynthesis glycosyltransferase TuaH